MGKEEVFEFDGFHIKRESFLGKDCYGIVTDCKKDEEGDSYHVEVEFDLSKAKFSFAKCYAHQVVPVGEELSSLGKMKVMLYVLKQAASVYLSEKGTKEKVDFAKLKEMYHEGDVGMGELLADVKADGLNIEEAFYLYILGQNWANGDGVFALQEDQETLDLVEEAEKYSK